MLWNPSLWLRSLTFSFLRGGESVLCHRTMHRANSWLCTLESYLVGSGDRGSLGWNPGWLDVR